MFIFLSPKCKVNAKRYSDHAASAQTQQNDIQVLQQRSEQWTIPLIKGNLIGYSRSIQNRNESLKSINYGIFEVS